MESGSREWSSRNQVGVDANENEYVGYVGPSAESLRKGLRDLKEQIPTLENKIAALTNETATKDTRIAALANETADMETRIEALANETAAMDTEIAALAGKTAAMERQRDLALKARELERAMRILEKEKVKVMEEKDKIREEKVKVMEEKDKIREEMDKIKEQMLTLQIEMGKFPTEFQKCKDLAHFFSQLDKFGIEQVPVDHPIQDTARSQSPLIYSKRQRQPKEGSETSSANSRSWTLSNFYIQRCDGTESAFDARVWEITRKTMFDLIVKKLCNGDDEAAEDLVNECAKAVERLRAFFAWLRDRIKHLFEIHCYPITKFLLNHIIGKLRSLNAEELPEIEASEVRSYPLSGTVLHEKNGEVLLTGSSDFVVARRESDKEHPTRSWLFHVEVKSPARDPSNSKHQLMGQSEVIAQMKAVLMTEASITEATMVETQIMEAPMTAAPMTEASMTEATMVETQIMEAPMTEAPMTEASMTEATMVETQIMEAPITAAPMTEASMTEATMVETQIMEAPMTEAPIMKASITEATIMEAPITEAPIAEVTMVEAEIKEAGIKEAGIKKAYTPVFGYYTNFWKIVLSLRLPGESGDVYDRVFYNTESKYTDPEEYAVRLLFPFCEFTPGELVELTKDSLKKDSEVMNSKEEITEKLSLEGKSDFQHGDDGTPEDSKELKKTKFDNPSSHANLNYMTFNDFSDEENEIRWEQLRKFNEGEAYRDGCRYLCQEHLDTLPRKFVGFDGELLNHLK